MNKTIKETFSYSISSRTCFIPDEDLYPRKLESSYDPMSDEQSSPRRTDSEWGEDDQNPFLIGIEDGEYLYYSCR